jgi:hypothetical protein
MGEERVYCTVREKKIHVNEFNDRGKLSAAFDRTMLKSNVYENNIFPKVLCDIAKIYDIII